jgi:hypothetical protein
VVTSLSTYIDHTIVMLRHRLCIVIDERMRETLPPKRTKVTGADRRHSPKLFFSLIQRVSSIVRQQSREQVTRQPTLNFQIGTGYKKPTIDHFATSAIKYDLRVRACSEALSRSIRQQPRTRKMFNGGAHPLDAGVIGSTMSDRLPL